MVYRRVEGEGERGVLASCIAVVVRPLTLACLQHRDGARQVFPDQADLARIAVTCSATRMKGEQDPTENHM